MLLKIKLTALWGTWKKRSGYKRTIPKVLARDHNRIVIKLSLLAIPLSLFLWLVGRWLVYSCQDGQLYLNVTYPDGVDGGPLSNSIQLVVLFTHTGRFTGTVESFLIYSKLLLFSSSPAIECVGVCVDLMPVPVLLVVLQVQQ